MQRMTDEKMLAQRGRLRALADTTGMALLHGSELNIAADGSVDWDGDFLSGFDICVASVQTENPITIGLSGQGSAGRRPQKLTAGKTRCTRMRPTRAWAGQCDRVNAVAAEAARRPDGEADADVLSEAAETLAAAGQYDRARAIADSIADAHLRAYTLAPVAEELARAGRTQSAAELVSEVCATDPWEAAIRPALLLAPAAYAPVMAILKPGTLRRGSARVS